MPGTRQHWGTARKSAWQQFGRRHYRLFVYGHLAARAVPWLAGITVLAGVVFGVRWVWVHVNPGTVALLAGIGAAVVLLGWAGIELVTVSARRKGFSAQRLLLFAASSSLCVASVMAVMHR